jgi:hypothetical protein
MNSEKKKGTNKGSSVDVGYNHTKFNQVMTESRGVPKYEAVLEICIMSPRHHLWALE